MVSLRVCQCKPYEPTRPKTPMCRARPAKARGRPKSTPKWAPILGGTRIMPMGRPRSTPKWVPILGVTRIMPRRPKSTPKWVILGEVYSTFESHVVLYICQKANVLTYCHRHLRGRRQPGLRVPPGLRVTHSHAYSTFESHVVLYICQKANVLTYCHRHLRGRRHLAAGCLRVSGSPTASIQRLNLTLFSALANTGNPGQMRRICHRQIRGICSTVTGTSGAYLCHRHFRGMSLHRQTARGTATGTGVDPETGLNRIPG